MKKLKLLVAQESSMEEKFSNKELSDFLKSKNAKDASLVDKVKIGYRPYICPFGNLLAVIPNQSSVFDIGCGSGMFLSLASKFKNPRIIGGIEISKQLIDNARIVLQGSKASVFLNIFDGKNIPPEINNYDYIFLIDVLHHVPQYSQAEFIKAVYAKMSFGSKLIFKDIDASRIVLSKFNKLHDLILSGEMGNELRSDDAEKILSQSGFKIISIEKRRVLWYPHYTIVCEK